MRSSMLKVQAATGSPSVSEAGRVETLESFAVDKADLDEAFAGSVGVIVAGGAIVYLALAASHWLVLAPPLRAIMAATAFATAVVYGAVWYLARQRRIADAWSHPLGFAIVTLAMANSLLHLALASDPNLSTNIALVQIGSGLFLLSVPWLVASQIVGLAGWVGVVAALPPSPHWLHFGFLVAEATALASVVFAIRLRARKNLIRLGKRDQAQNLALKEAADAAGRAVAAEHANQAKGVFLANMSHELRTPLSAIISFAELIEQADPGPTSSADARRFAADIRGNARHLFDLVNDILDLAKAEAGRHELREANVEPADLIGSSARMVRSLADRGGVTLIERVAGDLPPLRADGRLCRQMLLNLLSNAIKFTPAGGMVTVGAALDDLGRITIEVADTGRGIAEADLPRVLEPFRQVGEQSTLAQQGTGLGLPLAKAFAELHGADFAIHSKVGEGTRVTVRFPVHRTKTRT